MSRNCETHRDEPEPCAKCTRPGLWLVLTEEDARKMVGATENGEAYRVVEILKRQSWWPEIVAAVRGLRHLKPREYLAEFATHIG